MWVFGTARNLGVVSTKWIRQLPIEPRDTPLLDESMENP